MAIANPSNPKERTGGRYTVAGGTRAIIRIRQSANSGVEIQGGSEELLAIRALILGLAEVEAGMIELSGDSTGSPSPFDRWLERIIISSGSGLILALVRTSREFNISANPECLRVLASFFSVPDGAQHGWHTHLEFYPGNQWIAENSEPTVISLTKPVSA